MKKVEDKDIINVEIDLKKMEEIKIFYDTLSNIHKSFTHLRIYLSSIDFPEDGAFFKKSPKIYDASIKIMEEIKVNLKKLRNMKTSQENDTTNVIVSNSKSSSRPDIPSTRIIQKDGV